MQADVLDRPASAGRSNRVSVPEVWTPTAVADPPSVSDFPIVGESCCGFTLISELGRGSFGRVYLAEQAALAGRRVALKVSSDISSEASALAQLQHTHIVPVYSIHEDGPWRAVCMPYLGALTLQDIMQGLKSRNRVPVHGSELVDTWRKRKSTVPHAIASTVPNRHRPSRQPSVLLLRPDRPLSSLELLEGVSFVDAASWLVAALADGLQHAHDRGILHRDLKPANVLIGDDGTPMLVDFNLAEDLKGRSALGAALLGGTLPYMSPEQIDEYHGFDAVVDSRSDVYSLGVVLFELLTGRLPFNSTDGSEWEPASATRKGPPSARLANPNVSSRLDVVLQKCLAPRPEDRYQSASELQQDLYCCLQDAPLEYADDPGFIESARRFLDRRRTLVWSFATASVVAAVVSAAWSASVWREKIAAASTWAEIEPQLQQATLLQMYEVLDRGELREAEIAAVPLLARYRVVENERWYDEPLVARLPQAEREQLRLKIAGMLIALAEARRVEAVATPTDDREKLLRDALTYNSRAVAAWKQALAPAALARQRSRLETLLESGAEVEATSGDWDDQSDDAKLLDAELAAVMRDFDRAHGLLTDVLSRRPNQLESRFLLGAVYRAERRTSEAIAAFEACIAQREGDAFLRRIVAMLQLASRDPASLQKAAANLTLAYDRERNTQTIIEQSRVWQSIGMHAIAVERIREAMKKTGHSVWNCSQLATTLRAMNLPLDAAVFEAKANSLPPLDYMDWLSRADSLASARKTEGAVGAWRSAIEKQPWRLQAICFLGRFSLEDPSRAVGVLPLLERAVKLFPDCQLPQYQRVLALACAGEREAATKALDEYVAKYPDDRELELTIARTLAQTSRWEPHDARYATRFLWGALSNNSTTASKVEKDLLLAPIVSLPECQTLLAHFRDREEAAKGH